MLWFTIFFLVILKIPAAYLGYVIWWAVKDPPNRARIWPTTASRRAARTAAAPCGTGLRAAGGCRAATPVLMGLRSGVRGPFSLPAGLRRGHERPRERFRRP